MGDGKNYKVEDNFSHREFEQTDFGGIYHNDPAESKSPASIEELSAILKKYNDSGTPVTVRNTGHSVNGQTLTDGVQVNLSKLKKIIFNEECEEVTVEAGVSWHELFQAIDCSKYSTAVFPNNPYQQIQIGGTAAVGGIGFFGSKYGGFWNIVKKITLVTMEGKILECSRNLNPELFAYSLGGYGRIGVMANITFKVSKHSNRLFFIGLACHNGKEISRIVEQAMKDDKISGVLPFYQLRKVGFLKWFKIMPSAVCLIIEAAEDDDPHRLSEYIKRTYKADIFLYIKETKDELHTLDFSSKPTMCSRKALMYWYPVHIHVQEQFDLCHPWADCVISKDRYDEFFEKATAIVRKYKMEQYLIRYSAFNDKHTFDVYGSYVIKKMEPDTKKYFPLSLDLDDGNSFSYMLGIFPAVPLKEVDRAIHMINEIDNLLYAMGGKRYLYGYHDLSPQQIEQHFGKDVIENWNRIKAELDPKNLLNIGVIEHLDKLG